MTKREYDRVQQGNTVWCHFSNSYLEGEVVDKKDGKIWVRAQGSRGPLARWARYQSVDKQKRG